VVGRPSIDNAEIHAVVEEHVRDAKKLIFKKKRRKGYKRLMGHRQVRDILVECVLLLLVSQKAIMHMFILPAFFAVSNLLIRFSALLSPNFPFLVQELTGLRITHISGVEA